MRNMRNTLAPEQFKRLPKYAQDYIREIETKARVAEACLDAWTAEQTKTKDIEIEHKGVHLRISGMWNEKEDIQLSWTPVGRGFPSGSIGLVPTATQQAKLVNLAFNEVELRRLINLKESGEQRNYDEA